MKKTILRFYFFRMDVTDSRCTLLTNAEVYEILKGAKAKQGRQTKASQNHNTIVYETLKYLNTTPSATQNKSKMVPFLKDIAKFKLTAAETMQIINLRPEHPIEVQLVVEECEERLSEEEVLELINIVVEYFPKQNANETTHTNSVVS